MAHPWLPLLLLLGACSRAPAPGSAPPETSNPTPGTTPPESSAPTPAPPQATTRASRGDTQDLQDTLAFFAGRPREETPLDAGLVPVQGVGDRSAETCGACHQAIYAEWRTSTHRHAWHDPQFQVEIQKSDNTWLCRNCHTPTLAQQPLWPVGLTDDDVEAPILVENTRHEPDLMDEGVTCVGCHVRDGIIHGPGLPDSQAPHPVAASTDIRSGTLCLRCHQAERTYPGKGFVCTFTTGEEWRTSQAAADGQTCVTCHMPAIERPVAVGGPPRSVRRHWFKGSGIPKDPSAASPSDAAPGPALGLRATRTPDGVRLTARNTNLGHPLPAGDPERWVQVRVHPLDADGASLGEPVGRRWGQVWAWHPRPERLRDDRLQPGAEATFDVPLPAGTEAVKITASSHRMSQENADYHGLSDRYPLSVPTHRHTLEVADLGSAPVEIPVITGPDAPAAN